MTSGMVTTQKDEPLIFRGEMDNPQPSPKGPLGLRMLFTGQMVVGGLKSA